MVWIITRVDLIIEIFVYVSLNKRIHGIVYNQSYHDSMKL